MCMNWANIFWAALRILFGAFFIYAPVMIIVQFGGNHPPEAVPEAAALTGALNASGFMNPLLMIVCLVGGAAMLSDRLAPVGLILLAPPIAVIASFHWFLTGNYVWGSIWPVWLAILAWRYRSVFLRLIAGRSPPEGGK
jgi:hypothetical protein